MTQAEIAQVTRVAIAQALQYRREKVIAALQSVGIYVTGDIKQDELTVMVLKAIGDSERFRGEMAEILTDVTSTENVLSDNADKWYTGLVSAGNVTNVFNTGLGLLSTSLVSNANKGSEQRALDLERERTEQLRLALELQAQKKAQGGGGGATGAGMSTGLKIGLLAGGLIVISGLCYLAFRSPNKQ